MITRNKSIITNGKVEELYSIKKFPVFIGITKKDISTDIFYDLTFDICKETGMIQLRNLIDSDIIYAEFHSENIGEIWESHHNLLSEIISTHANNKKILEIGGSDSRLALKTININEKIKNWTIIEPILKGKIENKKIVYIEKFFDQTCINREYDIVVHSHVLEHMIDVNQFLQSISKSMKYGQYHIFSVPHLYKWLQNKLLNTITFEHTSFLTEEFIDYFLSCNNFKIIDKIFYREHSILYVTKKQKTNKLQLPNKYTEYKELYLQCINYYKNIVNSINKELENTNNDVYLFGAAFVSQYLIALGLNTLKIKCILDNSPIKSGKRLYGTNLFIKSPNDVVLDENSLIILKVGHYKDEIKQQLIGINSNIKFYE